MSKTLDLFQLLLNPEKIKSTCFMCFNKNCSNMLNVFENNIYIEGFQKESISLFAILKEILPSQEILLPQTCQSCVDMILNLYTYLRRKKYIEEQFSVMLKNISKSLDIEKSVKGKIYLPSFSSENLCKENKSTLETTTVEESISYEDDEILKSIEKDEICHICFKSVPKKNFKRHVRQHNRQNKKCYSCDTCNYVTKCKTTLEGHINSKHLNTRPYICTCSKRFFTKSALSEHSKTHVHKKDIICEICGDTFHYKKSLDNHLKLHSNNKMFECLVCNQRFVNKSRVNDHIKRKHGEKREICFICNKKFVLKKEMKRHMKLVHKDSVFDNVFDFQGIFDPTLL